MNYPGEDMSEVVKPESLVGPYLFFMGPDANKRTAEKINFGKLPADTKWPGE